MILMPMPYLTKDHGDRYFLPTYFPLISLDFPFHNSFLSQPIIKLSSWSFTFGNKKSHAYFFKDVYFYFRVPYLESKMGFHFAFEVRSHNTITIYCTITILSVHLFVCQDPFSLERVEVSSWNLYEILCCLELGKNQTFKLT